MEVVMKGVSARGFAQSEHIDGSSKHECLSKRPILRGASSADAVEAPQDEGFASCNKHSLILRSGPKGRVAKDGLQSNAYSDVSIAASRDCHWRFVSSVIGMLMMISTTGAADDEIVVSATRSPLPVSEVGASVTVIEAPEIELRQYESVADILRDAPGVSVARNSAFGGVASARLRGAASGQSLVVIDGIVVNDPSAPSGGFNFANLDVVDIARIEILRGPQSILYGSDAIGGVISITTKRAEDGIAASGFAEGGSNGFARGAATISGAGASLDGRLTVSGLRTDGISRAASGSEADGFRSIVASFAGGAEFTPALRAEIFARYGDAHAEIDGFPPPFFTLADTLETEDTEEYAVAGRLLHQSARLTQSLTLSFNNIMRENRDSGVFLFGADGKRSSAEYFARFEFSDRFAALAGAEGEITEVSVSGVDDDANAGSVFALVEVKPFEGFALSGGVRRDEFDEFDGATTGRVTAAWQAGPATIIRASWGQGFRAPSLFQLNFNLFGGPPNPVLEPERSDAFDASIEQDLADGLTAKVTLFHQKVRDQIDFDFATGGFINIDRTRSRGVEVEASWAPVAYVSISGNYSYIDAIDRASGLQLLRQPKHGGAVFVDVEASDRLKLGASLIANGREIDVGADNDSWARLDLRAAYALNDALEIYGRIENATDSDYQDVAGYAEPGRSVFAGVRVRI
jgi:vitamin B12 transporter